MIAGRQRENRIAVGLSVSGSYGEGYGILPGACKPTRGLLVHGCVRRNDAYDGMGITVEARLSIFGWIIDQQVHRVKESTAKTRIHRGRLAVRRKLADYLDTVN